MFCLSRSRILRLSFGHEYILCRNRNKRLGNKSSNGDHGRKSPTTAIEPCINNYCQFITNPSTSNIVFPINFVAFTHRVEVSAWNDGKLTYQQEVIRQHSPVWELIDCPLCLELIYKLNCWSKIRILMTGSILITVILTLSMLLPAIRFHSIVIKLSVHLCRQLAKKTFSKIIRKRKNFAVYTGYRRRLLLAILFTVICSSNQCSEVISLTATEETCTRNGEQNTCTFNQASILTLQPLSQETGCLVLKNSNNTYVGMITIRVKRLYFTCKRKIGFFTRDHHFYSESVHRCRIAGSCNTGTCDKVSPGKIQEISHTANSHPGYTFCAASCGCLTCSGCFFCLTSCLFYRYYAYPELPTIYTVFNCPLWEFTVEAHVTLQQNGHSESTDIVLHPAKTTRRNNIRLSLIASMVPQMPVLSSTFVIAGQTTAITKPASSGQLIPNAIGQLQCMSRDDAKHFRCK